MGNRAHPVGMVHYAFCCEATLTPADGYLAAELVAADIGENTVNWRQSVYQDLYNVVHW